MQPSTATGQRLDPYSMEPVAWGFLHCIAFLDLVPLARLVLLLASSYLLLARLESCLSLHLLAWLCWRFLGGLL